MEDGKRDEELEKKDEGSAKKMKYTQPELISLDKDKGAEGVSCGSVGSSVSPG